MKHEPDVSSRAPRQPTRADFARTMKACCLGDDIDHVVVRACRLTWDKPTFRDFPGWLDEQDG